MLYELKHGGGEKSRGMGLRLLVVAFSLGCLPYSSPSSSSGNHNTKSHKAESTAASIPGLLYTLIYHSTVAYLTILDIPVFKSTSILYCKCLKTEESLATQQFSRPTLTS